MTRSKITPGRWNYKSSAKGTGVFAKNGLAIAWCCEESWSRDLSIGIGNAKSNARLMAASPDLLVACEWALHFGKKDADGSMTIEKSIVEMIEKALKYAGFPE